MTFFILHLKYFRENRSYGWLSLELTGRGRPLQPFMPNFNEPDSCWRTSWSALGNMDSQAKNCTAFSTGAFDLPSRESEDPLGQSALPWFLLS